MAVTQQLTLVLDELPDGDLVAVRRWVLDDLEHLGSEPSGPGPENAAAHARLVAGATMLLDWLLEQRELPSDPLRWPCSACRVQPGTPCLLYGPAPKGVPEPRYHLGRGEMYFSRLDFRRRHPR